MTRPEGMPVAGTSHGGFPGYGDASPLDLDHVGATAQAGMVDRLLGGTFEAWSDAAARVGHCAQPIKLVGSSSRVDRATGEVVSSYSSAQEPFGVTYVRCGNRRASVCPACSRIYARDTFEMIRAGVVGGKSVPERVSGNPLVFLTLTAPSFGSVHTAKGGQRCRPRDGHEVCEHGRPVACWQAHESDDLDVGTPICPDCYDYAAHVIWQWWAPELWRRFTITTRRVIARAMGVPASRLREVVTLQYAKVAEYQARGVVHFHALVRLDGPKTADGYAPAPEGVSAGVLAGMLEDAAGRVGFDAPPCAGREVRRLSFGAQVDARSVTATRVDDPDAPLVGEQVAGYLAKYATKAASDTTDPRRASGHYRRLRATIDDLAAHRSPEDEYELLGKWVHMLGFRGHFSSKSRCYSITLGALRRARQRWQRIAADSARDGCEMPVLDFADLMADEEEETTLVVGSWSYVGTGWDTDADTALALAAADRARAYDQWRAEKARATTTR
ncbi:hypothetical protein O9K63_14215 [Janibacter cremeus]|uniref:replication initiator n=1 Tax=Janibacter cremeus TaxID=1285192 RepID=UPI0023F6C25D|nr:replication initiator [Janibacter cremeus]WEV77731.1 hypothetical protein O9K63_14215 [Janibacter cremeus]